MDASEEESLMRANKYKAVGLRFSGRFISIVQLLQD